MAAAPARLGARRRFAGQRRRTAPPPLASPIPGRPRRPALARQTPASSHGSQPLPANLARGDLILIIVCSVVISTLAGLLPAWRASRLKPVEALRND